MRSSLKIRRLLLASLLGTCAMAGLGTASASPQLQIVLAAGATDNEQETLGDAGGTKYPNGFGGSTGPGIPTAAGGWPTGPSAAGMGPDPSFGGALGTTGFHMAYVTLTEAADVTFQYMGKGDSSLSNQFWIDWNRNGAVDGGDQKLFDSSTTPCTVTSVTPACQDTVNQFTFHFGAGLVPFVYVTGNGVTLANNGTGNTDPDTGVSPGYFLGVDPYLATKQFQTAGSAVYAALSDLPSAGDHDYQDMGVRLSVPEPGTLALLGVAVAGMGYVRRRQARQA